MSLFDTARAVVDLARASAATVLDGARGRLTPERCDEHIRWFCEKVVRDAAIDLVVRGREHAEGTEPFVVMSNHQSHYDIPVLYCSVPGRMRMVAKAELFRVPLWGEAMRKAGFVRVDRADRAQAVASLTEASRMLEQGVRIWIAPEGTRSPTGALGPFKSGGFRMALATGTRILPIAIQGTRDVLRARGVLVRRGQRVVVTILPPVDPTRYGIENRRGLIRDVRDAIASVLAPPTL